MDIDRKLRDILEKGAKVSKAAFEKAGDAVQEFSDKSVVRLERKQLENRRDTKYTELGRAVAVSFMEKGQNVFKSDTQEGQAFVQEILPLLDEIAGLDRAISGKDSRQE